MFEIRGKYARADVFADQVFIIEVLMPAFQIFPFKNSI